MRGSFNTKFLSWLAAAAVLLAPLPALAAAGPAVKSRGRAAGRPSKLAEDLRDRLRRKERVAVIVQTRDTVEGDDEGEGFGSKGVRVGQHFRHVGAFAAEVPGDELESLAAREDVLYVSPDRPIEATGHLETTTGADLARAYGSAATGPLDGRGVRIAVLDSGVDDQHQAFLPAEPSRGRPRSRVVAHASFVSGERPKLKERNDDDYGHGTHVASVAAGGERLSNGAYTGVAPGADLVSVKVLGADGSGRTSDAIAAIDWVIERRAQLGIRVMNLSFGAAAVDSYKDDPLCKAVEKAWRAGVVVVAAAGNSGRDAEGRKIYGAIHSPGISPFAITVGATNTFGTDWRGDDGVASYSSRGPTRGSRLGDDGVRRYDNLIKPDLVAPGNKLLAASAPGSRLAREHPELVTAQPAPGVKGERDVLQLSGTSVAAPAVAGAAALLVQRNPSLTPNLVKAILEYTAQPLAGFNTLEQGAGQLNVEGAARLAGLIRADAAALPVGAPLLAGPAPAASSTVAGTEFAWAGGLVQRWNVVSGAELMQTNQGVYVADGVSLAEGVTISEGVTLSERTLRLAGGLLSRGVTLSEGVMLSDGLLVTRGSLVLNGVVLGDGVILGDNLPLADGRVAPVSLLGESALSKGLSALLSGDVGGAMSAVKDW